MHPSQPDDAGSPTPGKPSRSGARPVPPAVVYALDCLERGTPAQVRRHLTALGYSPGEAAEAVRAALACRDGERPSAWSPEDGPARRCMSLGFLLLVFGIFAGCARTWLLQRMPTAAAALNVFAWGGILIGLAIFCLGLMQMRIRRP